MRRSGFTLLEVLLAVTVLAVAVVGAAIAFRAALQTAGHARLVSQAMEIAQREAAMAMTTAESLHDRAGSAGRHHWSVSYSEKPLGLVQVRVQVTWSEQGADQAVQIQELFKPRRSEEATP